MLAAFNRLTTVRNSRSTKYVNSRLYDKLKKERSVFMSNLMKEMRKKMGTGYKVNLSEETRRRQRERFLKIQNKDVRGAKNGNAKAVICLDTLEIFGSAADAAVSKWGEDKRSCGNAISKVCRQARTGNYIRCRKFFWMFYDTKISLEEYGVLYLRAKKKVHDSLSISRKKWWIKHAKKTQTS